MSSSDSSVDGKLMLVDGHSLVHRAFHALPPLSTSSGEVTNAVFGFASMLLKAIDTVKPSHVLMALDRPVPTLRHKAFAAYKAQRPPTPQPLVVQFDRVREIAEAMNMPIYELDTYEADDLLGTLSRQAEEEGLESIIVTGDLDALQLVTDSIRVLTSKRGFADTVLYDAQAVRERYGLEPSQLPDFKALVGDTSDNIPGVAGIGGKTASKLLAEYGSIEGIYENIDKLPAKLKETLEPVAEQAYQSRELARIMRDVPIELALDGWSIDRPRLLKLFSDLEFHSLVNRVPGSSAAPVPANPVSEVVLPPQSAEQLSMFPETESPATPAPGPETETRVVTSEDALGELLAVLKDSEQVALDTEASGTDPIRAELVGLSFAVQPNHGWYVPVGHFSGEQLATDTVIADLRPFLEDRSLRKIGHNLKYDRVLLSQRGVRLEGIWFDTMIAAYLLNPTSRGLSLSALALARFGIEMTPIETLIGKGRKQITLEAADIGLVARYAAADADMSLRLMRALDRDLVERELAQLFHEVEMPLTSVLADMECAGVTLDPEVLKQMSDEMAQTLGELEGRIYDRVGYRFNINSPQQLGQLLFGQLKLPSRRRGKTGQSTDNEVLEGLRGQHPIIDDLLEFRQLIKLKNTYVDALPALINPATGKVHTDFNQTVTATGRLSSSNPNLQNIPIRGELGRKIRRAFVAGNPEHLLLAADYSQIELRVLASMSGDERLRHAFVSGEDIHVATASAVFGVPPEEVTADQRRIAKIVNFGIVYGIGEQRLAYETGISRAEAASFIANYNQTYAGVKVFMDDMRKRAAYYGYVSTLLNRRRYIADIHSDHPGIRQAAERAAINMPIQGTAADIIKVAMIGIRRRLSEQGLDAHMVLQVHDELVFDVPGSELEEVAPIVREVMEQAVELDVPLEVEMKAGHNWYEMGPVAAA